MSLPQGTVTFLFTDIQDSTPLLERLGPARYRELVEDHAQIMRAAIAGAGGGVDLSTAGDSFFAVFTSAPQALFAAVEAQRNLSAHPWPEDGVVRVRMGLHTGEGIAGGDNYVGIDVNIAARIEAAGHGGQILISQATRTLVERSLPDGVSLTDLGEQRLKGLATPERIFQVGIPGLPSDFPTLRTVDARPNNLPPQLTSFVGRDREIEEIEKLLSSHRLVTLTGPGGTGKTRLSLKVASQQIDRFTDGIFFVALAPISDPDLVASTIAQTLKLLEEPGRPILETLEGHLKDKEMLLVLDNFEQVTAAGPAASRLLVSATDLKMLVTSREMLHVSGEQEYPVPPLALPDFRHLPPLEALSQFESVALFIERSTAVNPSFEVTNDNAPAIAEITARLDGLPLAIELAAARTRLLTPQAILARMQSSLVLLTGGARDLPARQQTLRGAIEWSYDLLDEQERALFRRLSVFVGGWTLEEAERIANPASELGLDILDGISSLGDKSLIKQEETEQGEPRFMMLETIREYGLERLIDGAESTEMRRRHAEVLLELAEQAQPEFTGKDQIIWLDRIGREHENMRAALRYAIDEDLGEIALRLGSALWRYWHLRGHFTEGRQWLSESLALPSAQERNAVRARGVNSLGSIEYWQSEFETSSKHYEDALGIFRDLGDKPGEAESLYNLAYMAGVFGDRELAKERYGASASIYEELSNEQMVMLNKFGISLMESLDGQYEKSNDSASETIKYFEASGHRWGIAHGVWLLARNHVRMGNFDEGWKYLTQGLELAMESREMWSVAAGYEAFAALARGQGRLPRSLKISGAAEAIRDSMGGGAPLSLTLHEDPKEAVRGKISDEDIDTFWKDGYSMSFEEALEYVRGDKD